MARMCQPRPLSWAVIVGSSETRMTMECLKNRKSKRGWSIISGERVYGVQVREKKGEKEKGVLRENEI